MTHKNITGKDLRPQGKVNVGGERRGGKKKPETATS